MHLLAFQIHEPIPGQVLPEMAVDVGAEEAAVRYRATVLTTLRQLRGLVGTRIRLHVSPVDAEEAVRFWLLPRLAPKWQADGNVFRSEGWEIDWGDDASRFDSKARGEIMCPDLGGRWVHAALVGIGRSVSRVIGPTGGTGEYFRAEATIMRDDLPERILPRLPVIHTDFDWQIALQSAVGPKLRSAWEEESNPRLSG